MEGADAGRAVTSFQVVATGDGGASTAVQLAHTQDVECGGHILQVSCGLWVYNCTGMPLALQQGDLDGSRLREQDTASFLPCSSLHTAPASIAKRQPVATVCRS